jgi:hypothetical protein
MTDPTGTPAGHPALLTATGPAAPPTPGGDATGTPAGHPAIVTRLPYLPPAPKPVKKKHRRRRRHAADPPRFTG